MARFDGTPGPGRGKGSKNKLQKRFFDDFLKHWEEEGHKALGIVFRENPVAYLKILASVMPKDFFLETNHVQELGYDELDRLIEIFERQFGNHAREVSGLPQIIEGPAQAEGGRKQDKVLQALSETDDVP